MYSQHVHTPAAVHTYTVNSHSYRQMPTEGSTFTSTCKNIAKTTSSTLADQDQKPLVEYTHPHMQKGTLP